MTPNFIEFVSFTNFNAALGKYLSTLSKDTIMIRASVRSEIKAASEIPIKGVVSKRINW